LTPTALKSIDTHNIKKDISAGCWRRQQAAVGAVIGGCRSSWSMMAVVEGGQRCRKTQRGGVHSVIGNDRSGACR